MVPPVSPKGPYIKVVNEDNKRHHGGGHHGGGHHGGRHHGGWHHGGGHHGGRHHGGKHTSKKDSCESCANCKNGSGFTCDKSSNYSFANMNHVPPPLTSNALPPMSAPTSKYEPRPRLTSFAAFGR